MSIEINSQGKVQIVAIEGRIDSSNVGELESALETARKSSNRLVIDMSKVDYFSSMGIRALISTKKKCAFRLGDLRLASPSEVAQDVIEIAGLDHVFKIFDTTDLAVESF